MSSLPTDSYASLGIPLWLAAQNPIETPSPFAVVDAIPPTKSTFIVTKDTGDSTIVLANSDTTNPVAMAMSQGVFPSENTVSFITNGATTALTIGSNVTCAVPFVLDTPACATNLLMDQSPTGTTLQQGTGGKILLAGAGNVTMNNYVTADTLGNMSGFIGGAGWQLANSINQLGFLAPGATAVFGQSGTSAYMGAGSGTPTFNTPGILVSQTNGATLRFNDLSTNSFQMYGAGSNLVIATPSVPGPSVSAISVAPSGQVTIPDIVSGSFVPIGGIVMFSGLVGSLPANWKVCDGTFGTPDLRDRFVIGAGTFASGTAGGSSTISTAQLPAHNHGVTDPGHSHNVVLTGLFNNGDSGSAITYVGQSLTGGAGNRVSDPGAAQTTFTGVTTDNTGTGTAYYPPYYALAYIIRQS